MDRSPLSNLVLRTPRLELRLPTDGELTALAMVARTGVHDPQKMPFLVPWTDPSPSFVADFVAYHHTVREQWQPDDWRLELGVFQAGRPIGVQVMSARNFARERTVGSASWLGLDAQGHGYGTEMRTAILELAFAGLGAVAAVSGAFVDNPASARVSQKLGYVDDGVRWPSVRGNAVKENRFRLTRERFQAGGRVAVAISGLADCASLFGLTLS
ncbi:MAG TPA: GNAT family protein [Solirubrobacteraceae bacterium]|jgi:RimJ/RimL family protein N-acetyltransferase